MAFSIRPTGQSASHQWSSDRLAQAPAVASPTDIAFTSSNKLLNDLVSGEIANAAQFEAAFKTLLGQVTEMITTQPNNPNSAQYKQVLNVWKAFEDFEKKDDVSALKALANNLLSAVTQEPAEASPTDIAFRSSNALLNDLVSGKIANTVQFEAAFKRFSAQLVNMTPVKPSNTSALGKYIKVLAVWRAFEHLENKKDITALRALASAPIDLTSVAAEINPSQRPITTKIQSSPQKTLTNQTYQAFIRVKHVWLKPGGYLEKSAQDQLLKNLSYEEMSALTEALEKDQELIRKFELVGYGLNSDSKSVVSGECHRISAISQ